MLAGRRIACKRVRSIGNGLPRARQGRSAANYVPAWVEPRWFRSTVCPAGSGDVQLAPGAWLAGRTSGAAEATRCVGSFSYRVAPLTGARERMLPVVFSPLSATLRAPHQTQERERRAAPVAACKELQAVGVPASRPSSATWVQNPQ